MPDTATMSHKDGKEDFFRGGAAFSTKVKRACPYPYCSGTINNRRRCAACGRSALRCSDNACRAFNRDDALFCRICGRQLDIRAKEVWPMHGGDAMRAHYWKNAGAATAPDFARVNSINIAALSLGRATPGRIPHPISAPAGIILPNLSKDGFSLLIPEKVEADSSDPFLWHAGLNARVDAVATPVCLGADFYTAVEIDGEILLARVQIETGQSRFLEILTEKLNPFGTPVAAFHRDKGGVAAWGTEKGFLLLRLEKDLDTIKGRVNDYTVAMHWPQLEENELVHPPLISGERLYCNTSRGRILTAVWNQSRLALALQELQEDVLLEGDWLCGPAVFIPDAGLAFLAVDLKNGSKLHLAVVKSKTMAAPEEESIKLFPCDETVSFDLAQPFLFKPYYDGVVLMAPSTQRAGLYRLVGRAADREARLEFKELEKRVDSQMFLTTDTSLFLAAANELYVFEHLAGAARGTPSFSQPISSPLAAPLLHNRKFYLLCKDYLMEIPL